MAYIEMIDMETIDIGKVEITQRGRTSLGITIPSPLCRHEGLHAHQWVNVKIELIDEEESK